MDIGQLHNELQQALTDAYGTSEATAITEMVLEHFTGKTRVQQKLDRHLEVDTYILSIIQNAQQDLLRHKPVQYVLGEAWFMGSKFYVDASVLIPRPETEELVQLVGENLPSNTCSILDIGTGSGCIPISLKKRHPLTLVTSIDVSGAALTVAEENATTHATEIAFKQTDFLDESKWDKLPTFDIIVSNPPYIPQQEKDKLDKNVTDWEPGLALFVPDNDPLLFYRKIAFFGKKHLTPIGKIFVEMHHDHALQTQMMFQACGYQASIKKDINGNDRMLIASQK